MATRTVPALAVLTLALAPAGRARAEAIAADKLPEAPLVSGIGTGAESDFVRALHAHVHKRWADNFLRLTSEQLPATNALNNPMLAAEADIVVGPDGQLTSEKLTRSSGFPGFDQAVSEVLHDAVPYPVPPAATRSDDGRLHAHWVFARDQRRCAGVAIIKVYDPIEIAVPKLIRDGRRTEALNRMAMARSAGMHADPAFTVLAMDWMKSTLHEPFATVKQAKVIAARDRGNDEAVKWLKTALRRPELTAEVGAALQAVDVPVCTMIKGWFDTPNASDHETAARALATSHDRACAPGLASLLANTKARPEARAAAATALGSIDDETARKALGDVVKNEGEKAPVRAAAMLAQIRPGAGRVKVIAMERYLRDPQPDLRAAAAAGVVRAGGDANLADLYVLFKDNDPRPALASLRELDNLHTEESTKLIARLAKRPLPQVALAAAEILTRRKANDTFSVLRSYLDPSQKVDPALRGLALVAADEPALQAASVDPALGPAAFRARLARGERDLAADWFIAHGASLTPALQTACMTDWAATAPPPAQTGPTASKTGGRKMAR
jgi:HEAT repeat protein